MKRERITTTSVKEPPAGRWSNCLKAGGFAFVSGMTSRGDDGVTILGNTEYEQARVIFEKIQALIESSGGDMNDVVKMTIFITNIKNNKDIWQARQEYFSGDFPACTLVEVSALATPEIKVEIEAIGFLGDDA